MKKGVLILLTFVPIFVGWAVNLTILVPTIGMILFYVLPVLTTVFWIFLGKHFAHTSWKTIPAILIGNTTGIASILLYLWQVLLKTDETRNLTLTGISQMFSASAPGYILGRLAILFEREPNTIGSASAVALQVISVVYMIAIFSFAFLYEKSKSKNPTPQ